MARLAHGCAVTLLALAFLAPAAAGNTITTVAGGGTQDPGDYTQAGALEPLDIYLPKPAGIVWSGQPGGMFYVVPGDGECVSLWMQPVHDIDYGLNIEGGAFRDCAASTSGYPSTLDALAVKLKNPCCVASNWVWDVNYNATIGPLVASTDTGHVDFFSWWGNSGHTVAGAAQQTNCADPNLLPASGTAGTASFCNVVALARQFTSPYDYAFAERNRGTNAAIVYTVDASQNLYAQTGFGSMGALTWDRQNRLVVSDGKSAVKVFTVSPTPWTSTVIAGQPNVVSGFSGDGGTGPNARFAKPNGVTVGFDGALYIADTDNCRIRKLSSVSAAATVSTVAGNGCSAAALGDDGEAADANLDHPLGVAIAPTGLLISDTGHDRVRLIDRTTIVNAPAVTSDNTPAFDIRSLDTPANIKCRVDSVDADCAAIGPLTDGEHTLEAWEDGNAAAPPDPPDPTPAVATFTVDTTAPSGLSLIAPAAGAGGVPSNASFSWSAASDSGTGIDHYELWIDGVKNRDVPASACSGGTCAAAATPALAEGDRTWQVRAVDKVGNMAASETRNLNAGGPPTAAFTISPNPALAGRAVVFDASGSADESGIAHYAWDLDGDGSFETDGGTSPTTSRIYPVPTTITVHLQVTDGVGKQSESGQSLRVTSSASAQSLLGVSINSGAQYTNTPDVKLLVKAPATASSILVSNDGGFLAPATFPIAQSVDWKLDSSGPERLPKTVYVRFLLGPIVSENYTDDIILDEIPPVVQQAALTPTRGKAATAAKAKPYVVTVKAKDSNSGVGKVQVTANKRKPGKLLAYKAKVKVKSAAKPKYVRAQDRAGNFSKWRKLR